MKAPIKLLILLFTTSICCIANDQVHMNFKFDTPYGNNELVGKYVEINAAIIYGNMVVIASVLMDLGWRWFWKLTE